MSLLSDVLLYVPIFCFFCSFYFQCCMWRCVFVCIEKRHPKPLFSFVPIAGQPEKRQAFQQRRSRSGVSRPLRRGSTLLPGGGVGTRGRHRRPHQRWPDLQQSQTVLRRRAGLSQGVCGSGCRYGWGEGESVGMLQTR